MERKPQTTMTNELYTEHRASIMYWLASAISSHCPRTARARLRDLARLENETNLRCDYNKTYRKLLEEYELRTYSLYLTACRAGE